MGQRFHYSLIQYRGDPVRQEALNVGVAVVSDDGHSRVMIDRWASSRIMALWPNFNARVFTAFSRDVRHVLGDTHQLILGEMEQISGTVSSLEALAAITSNQFSLTAPRPYVGDGLEATARRLFRRLVREALSRAPRSDRHMTRAALKAVINDVLSAWAEAIRPELRIEPGVELTGRITTHTADLAAFDSSDARLIFFAIPLGGPTAPLIRDALPTVIHDLRPANPQAKFFAVLGQKAREPQVTRDEERVARGILGQVEGLEIMDISELRDKFDVQLAVEPR